MNIGGNMKRILFLVVIALVVSVPLRADGPGNRNLGIGLVLGAPTGLSVKYWESSKFAYQGSLGGWAGGITIGADYLIHSNAFNKTNVPFYYGPGVFFGSAGFGGPRFNSGDVALGARLMFGVDYLAPDHPFDIAFEIGPALLLTPTVGMGIEVGVAFRYYP